MPGPITRKRRSPPRRRRKGCQPSGAANAGFRCRGGLLSPRGESSKETPGLRPWTRGWAAGGVFGGLPDRQQLPAGSDVACRDQRRPQAALRAIVTLQNLIAKAFFFVHSMPPPASMRRVDRYLVETVPGCACTASTKPLKHGASSPWRPSDAQIELQSLSSLGVIIDAGHPSGGEPLP